MRLLLDEMCSPAVARQLRERDHDVIASLEHEEVRGRPDDAVLALAANERRAVATFNVGHFAALDARFRAEGRRHYGVILIPSRRFSPAADGIGALLDALDAALRERPADEALVNDRLWLTRP